MQSDETAQASANGFATKSTNSKITHFFVEGILRNSVFFIKDQKSGIEYLFHLLVYHLFL